MKRLALIAIAALTTVVSVADPAVAQGMPAHGAHEEGGRREPDRHQSGHHDPGHADRHDGHHFRRGPVIYYRYIPYYVAPQYVAPYPTYWYYCPSAEAYYPYVIYCSDAWVTVPAG